MGDLLASWVAEGGRRADRVVAQAPRMASMAWEWRGDRTYYYRSVRPGTRVREAYFGGGPAGELAAAVEADARARRAAEGHALAAERRRLGPADGALRALEAACALMADATLLAAG